MFACWRKGVFTTELRAYSNCVVTSWRHTSSAKVAHYLRPLLFRSRPLRLQASYAVTRSCPPGASRLAGPVTAISLARDPQANEKGDFRASAQLRTADVPAAVLQACFANCLRIRVHESQCMDWQPTPSSLRTLGSTNFEVSAQYLR